MGSVVANVIGAKNPQYSLFGDTVRMTTLMSQTGAANHVHCTALAARCLLRQCPALRPHVVPRGLLGRSEAERVETFWVLLEGQSDGHAEELATTERLRHSAAVVELAEALVEKATHRLDTGSGSGAAAEAAAKPHAPLLSTTTYATSRSSQMSKTATPTRETLHDMQQQLGRVLESMHRCSHPDIEEMTDDDATETSTDPTPYAHHTPPSESTLGLRQPERNNDGASRRSSVHVGDRQVLLV